MSEIAFDLQLTRDEAVDLCLLWSGHYARTGGSAPPRVLSTIKVIRDALVDVDSTLDDEQLSIWARITP